MTKEHYDIVEEETTGIFDQKEVDITGLSEAIDKIAKQQAIAFYKWFERSEWSGFMKSSSDERKTISEIYEIFLQSQNK